MNAALHALFGNPKTTILGAIAAAATYLNGQGGGWALVGSVAVLLLGAFAKDAGVTGTGNTPTLK